MFAGTRIPGTASKEASMTANARTQPATGQARKPYHRPTTVDYGSVVTLTRGNVCSSCPDQLTGGRGGAP
jgi:hypothetical protein